MKAPLLTGCDLLDYAARVTHEETGGVHEHALTCLGDDIESPMHGRREGVAHGLLFVRVVAARLEPVVGLHQQHARSGLLGDEDRRAAELAAVDADRIAAESAGHRHLVEELGVELVDLPEEFPGGFIPIEVEVAGHRGHADRALGDGRDRAGLGGGRCRDAADDGNGAQQREDEVGNTANGE